MKKPKTSPELADMAMKLREIAMDTTKDPQTRAEAREKAIAMDIEIEDLQFIENNDEGATATGDSRYFNGDSDGNIWDDDQEEHNHDEDDQPNSPFQNPLFFDDSDY